MRVAVIGAEGQLGVDVCQELSRTGYEVTALGHDRFELTDEASVRSGLNQVEPDVVINTAAKHHVERCEEYPEQAFAVNALGPRYLAQSCERHGIRLIHISTDYVFDGTRRRPYTETDNPGPLNTYGITKLAGEHFIRANTDNYAILRTSGLYGEHRCRDKGTNFVELMLKLAKERDQIRVVDNEVLTPTATRDLAVQIAAMVKSDRCGLFHATAGGSCSWYEFAREIFSLAGVTIDLQVAAPGEFPAKVPRPLYSVLKNERLRAAGLNRLGSWQEGLTQYLRRRAASVEA